MNEVFVHYVTGKRFRYLKTKAPWIELMDLSGEEKSSLWVHQSVFAIRYKPESPDTSKKPTMG